MKKQRYLKDIRLSLVLVVFMFFMYAVVYMTKNMFTSAMAVIVEDGFMTKSQTGLINAAFWMVYAVFQVIGGFAVDRYSPYKIIMIGLLGATLANLVIFFNQSYYVMMAAWVFNAVVQFGLWPGVFKVVSTQIAPRLRGGAVFWMIFSTSAGLGISMLIASFVPHWQYNFLISAVGLFAVIVIYAFLNRFLDRRMVEEEMAVKKPEQKSGDHSLLSLIMSSGLAVFLVVCLLRVAIDNGIKMMTPVMLMESYRELPAAITTRMSTVLIIFSAFGTFLAGFINRAITRNESKAQLLLYGISVLPLVAVCFIGHISYIWVLAALSVTVMMISGAAPFVQSFVTLRFGRYGRIGTVSGILNATASVGNVMASYVFARMAETVSWQGVALSWFIAVLVCIALCGAVLPKWTRFIKR